MNNVPSAVEQDIQRAITNAELKLRGAGIVGNSKDEIIRRSFLAAHNKAINDAYCGAARESLKTTSHLPQLTFCIQQALYFPNIIENIGL